jgi:glycosyltransferase involved in cell wall biosynthesis
MRILILHSRYLSGSASGENRVVEDEIQLLQRNRHTVIRWTPEAETETRLKVMATAGRAVWAFSSAEEVRRLIRSHRPDIVHVHNLFPTLSPAVLRTAAEYVPVVATLHNYRLMCLPATFLRDGRACQDCLGRVPWPGVVHSCYRGSLAGSVVLATSLTLHRIARSYDRVALFLAVSEFVRRKHLQAGFSPQRLLVKPNFSWPMPRREGPGEVFLFLGRLSPEKGVDTILRAWRPGHGTLLVAGSGPEEGRLRAMAPPGVVFVGSVDGSAVPDLLQRARALLLPSIGYEGQPRVVLEAYAAGVPVLASDVGGLPELVEDGRSGFLLPWGDPNAWTAAMQKLLADHEAVRLGRRGWQLWKERFSPERGLEGLEEVYQRAIGRETAGMVGNTPGEK